MSNKIMVLMVEAEKAPYAKEIENTLVGCQEQVEGLIQVLPLEDSLEGPQMVLNESGKILGLPYNRRIPHDIICGNFFICESDEEGEFISLSPENIKKYGEMFAEIPEYSVCEPDGDPKIFFKSC